MSSFLSTDGILKAFVVIGEDLKQLSSPGYYRSYGNENARRFRPIYVAARKAYAEIRDGGDAVSILQGLRKILPRAQQLQVDLILRGMNNDLEGTYYIVKDGFLVSIYEAVSA
jgi:hypothetical protein